MTELRQPQQEAVLRKAPAAARIAPPPGRRVSPLVRFGLPAVGGISTEAIADELDGLASLAEDFALGIGVVRWAQSYELSQRAVA
jgi:hypothetical protein